MRNLIYLDHNSSCPLAPEVLEAMLPFLTELHGNASSAHAAGKMLAAAVEEARSAVAELIGASPEEIYFTSGGTESNNWVVNGVTSGRFVTSAVEHFSILENLERMRDRGVMVAVIGVDRACRVDPEEFAAAIRRDTRLVSIVAAQAETGTIQPVAEIAAIAGSCGVLVHADGVQAVGKIPVDVKALRVDYFSIGAHKMYGPKGIGALYIRKGAPVTPWMLGAPHERGARAGTLNVPAIVGFGAAAKIAAKRVHADERRLRVLSRRLLSGLQREIPEVTLNGERIDSSLRLPNTVNVSLPGVLSYELLQRMSGVATTGGSACHSGSPSASRTLIAMGIPENEALGAVRFSLGRSNTEEEIDLTVQIFKKALRASQAPRKAKYTAPTMQRPAHRKSIRSSSRM